MKTYKVWIHIHQCEGVDEYDIVPPKQAGEYTTLSAAEELRRQLLEVGVDKVRKQPVKPYMQEKGCKVRGERANQIIINDVALPPAVTHKEKAAAITGMILGFEQACNRSGYTDTGEAWDILNQIKSILNGGR